LSDIISLEYVWEYLFSAPFARGAAMTIVISIVSLIGGMAVGLILALLQESRLGVLRAFTILYLWIFRGTPLLLQLVFAFNVLPSFGIVLSGFTCAIITLSLNEGAYMGEIMRSGIRAVGQGQRMAGRAHGMRDWQVLRWIVLPQAVRIIIPPVGNQFIGMLKMSALVSVISVHDLLMIASQTAAASFRYLEAFTAATIYYLALTSLFMLGQAVLENALKRQGKASIPWWRGWPKKLIAASNAGGVR
jgi:polar amino acid transport system permease protein